VLIASGAAADPARLRELLSAALPGDVVAVGQAFLLHLRTDAVPRIVLALGVAPLPIRREREAGKEARIVVLIVAPPKESSQYLQALSALARALGSEGVVEALLRAEGPDDVLAAAPLAKLELPGYLAVRDVMVRRRHSVRPDTTLGEVLKLMVRRGVHALPVVSHTNEVLGIVTHRELIRHLLPLYVQRMSGAHPARGRSAAGGGGDPHKVPVREVMDRSVLCVSEDQTLADVASMMIHRDIERLPVVRDGALVGFLTRGDIVRRLLGA
jgi:CBS domain-containing protein